uniref:Cocaine- and amphetamine-regulated transcript protein n=1 Tax=Sphaeramia orbicularis TaxID=375764 RepID=A0A672ZAI8_9TELE
CVCSVSAAADLLRLPGLCRRLKRRRVTILCNLEKFCWRGWSQRWGQSGQVCRCPRGLRCSHFFIHSL